MRQMETGLLEEGLHFAVQVAGSFVVGFAADGC